MSFSCGYNTIRRYPSSVRKSPKSAHTYNVDPAGDDRGPGSIERPFKTIQHAINVVQAAYSREGAAARLKNVNIAFGTYAETLSITCPVYLTGSAPSRYAQLGTCSIVGNIVVNIPTVLLGTMYQTQVGIFNVQISGTVTDVSVAAHALIMKDAFIYARSQCLRVACGSPPGTVVDSRTYLDNVAMNSSSAAAGDPVLEIASGVLEMTSCQLNARGLQSVFKLSGSASSYLIGLNTFENSSTGASVPPIVSITAEPLVPVPTPFSTCSFTYTSTTAKPTSPGLNTGIYMENSNSGIFLCSCVFVLAGTDPVAGNAVSGVGAVWHSSNSGSYAYKISNIANYPLNSLV